MQKKQRNRTGGAREADRGTGKPEKAPRDKGEGAWETERRNPGSREKTPSGQEWTFCRRIISYHHLLMNQRYGYAYHGSGREALLKHRCADGHSPGRGFPNRQGRRWDGGTGTRLRGWVGPRRNTRHGGGIREPAVVARGSRRHIRRAERSKAWRRVSPGRKHPPAYAAGQRRAAKRTPDGRAHAGAARRGQIRAGRPSRGVKNGTVPPVRPPVSGPLSRQSCFSPYNLIEKLRRKRHIYSVTNKKEA